MSFYDEVTKLSLLNNKQHYHHRQQQKGRRPRSPQMVRLVPSPASYVNLPVIISVKPASELTG